MPRFFYNTRRDGVEHRDTDGTELPDLARARFEAVQTLSDMAREEFPQDGDHQRIEVNVFDEAGRHILSAAISLDLDQAEIQD